MADDVTPAPDEVRTPKRRRRLDGRTIAICVCIALIAAVVTGLVASMVTDNGSGNSAEEAGKLSLSKPLLAVELTTVSGRPTRLQASVAGKPLLVNLWAQSCAPCVRELPLLQSLHASDPRVTVVGVDVQDRLEYAKKMAQQTGITYPWFQDPDGTFALAAEGTQLPKTLLISADGDVLATKRGAFKDRADLDAWLAKALP